MFKPAGLDETKGLIEHLIRSMGNDIVILEINKDPDNHPQGCGCRSCSYDSSEDQEIDLQGNPIGGCGCDDKDVR